ncbi:MAG: calcium/sodium antiporter [Firmicutes bacterium]|nr:calcium/sodium antiporter [Bacillota bacterium]
MVYLIFILSLVAVTKGADWLVEGAVDLARLWGVSQIVIGATIVSLGTTLPETLISAFAAAQGKGDVIVGTAIGSIIFNTAVILGLAAIIRPPKLTERQPFYKAGTMVGVLVLFALLAWDLYISRGDSILLAFILILFLGSNMWNGTKKSEKERVVASKNEVSKHLFHLIIGSIFVVAGAHFLLESGVEIARILRVPEAIIAVTLFAVGSSLPELITAITAASKGHTDLVLGNVMGANTLNIVFVISTAGLISPFSVAPSVLSVDVLFSLIMMSVLLIPALFTKKISRLQGIISIIAYFSYLGILIF